MCPLSLSVHLSASLLSEAFLTITVLSILFIVYSSKWKNDFDHHEKFLIILHNIVHLALYKLLDDSFLMPSKFTMNATYSNEWIAFTEITTNSVRSFVWFTKNPFRKWKAVLKIEHENYKQMNENFLLTNERFIVGSANFGTSFYFINLFFTLNKRFNIRVLKAFRKK